MYIVHGRGAEIFMRFGHNPILVQINLQHSQAYALVLFIQLKLIIYGAS
jgi:hypothetical protein